MNTSDDSPIQSEGKVIVLLFAIETECVWTLERLYLNTVPLKLNDLFIMN